MSELNLVFLELVYRDTSFFTNRIALTTLRNTLKVVNGYWTQFLKNWYTVTLGIHEKSGQFNGFLVVTKNQKPVEAGELAYVLSRLGAIR